MWGIVSCAKEKAMDSREVKGNNPDLSIFQSSTFEVLTNTQLTITLRRSIR